MKTTIARDCTKEVHSTNQTQEIASQPELESRLERILSNLDYEPLEYADALIAKGVKLPRPHKSKEADMDKYLLHLAQDPYDLYIALHGEPSLINAIDSKGMTILHHVASTRDHCQAQIITVIIKQLFRVPPHSFDFSIKASNGDTPLHIAASLGNDRVTSQFILPSFLKEAEQRGFDFTVKGKDGLTVLQLAVLHNYEHIFLGWTHNAKTVLDIAPSSRRAMNTLSTEGASALFYAITNKLFDTASQLLEYGADPRVFANEKFSPIAMLQSFIDSISQKIKKYSTQDQSESFDIQHAALEEELAKMKALKFRMEEQVKR